MDVESANHELHRSGSSRFAKLYADSMLYEEKRQKQALDYIQKKESDYTYQPQLSKDNNKVLQ